MSKHEVYDLLYEVMETLPSELILLIREYISFLPLTEEIRYFKTGLITCIHIVPLSTNRIILYGLFQMVLIENDELKMKFRYNDITSVLFALSRYDDNSFIVVHDNIIDKITITPQHIKTQIIKIDNAKEILHVHTDKDGCILASGRDGVLIISDGKIIQHLFKGQNCSQLRNDNILLILGRYKSYSYYRLFKINGVYYYDPINKIPFNISATSGNFGARFYGDVLSIQNCIPSFPITIQLPSQIYDAVILREKIYVLTSRSVHVFHEKLVTDIDLLQKQQSTEASRASISTLIDDVSLPNLNS